MSKLATFGLIVATIILTAYAAADADLVDITKIPQIPQGNYNFSLYSGYLNLDGDKPALNRSYHYVFATSMNNPKTDPVLLWLNGGPGCSSMAGWLNEIGPWAFAANGTQLEFNPYAWNSNASVIYLESPIGVGFSVGPDIPFNDTFTAQDSDRALRVFFTKFSEFAGNEFYISGESYAGIYIPSLAQVIHWSNVGGSLPKINLKGVAIGNGVVQVSPRDRDISQFRFYMRHNIISPEGISSFEDVCIFNYNENACGIVTDTLFGNINDSPLNPYDIYGVCYDDSHQVLPPSFKYNYVRFPTPAAKKKISLGDINPFGGLPPCADIVGATFFLNNKVVKAGLHLPEDTIWTVCSSTIKYQGGDFANMTETYQFLMSQGYRVMYYSGESDSVCPYDTAEVFFKSLVQKYNIPTIIPKKPWHIPGLFADEPQTTGFYEDYPNLRFMTFMGVGHMVPQWNRPGGQKMINTFLHQIALD